MVTARADTAKISGMGGMSWLTRLRKKF
jgi:hypothetical protein